jgi:hypothetical protein
MSDLTLAESAGVQIISRLDADTRNALIAWLDEYSA